jgi:hypothetical protein
VLAGMFVLTTYVDMPLLDVFSGQQYITLK